MNCKQLKHVSGNVYWSAICFKDQRTYLLHVEIMIISVKTKEVSTFIIKDIMFKRMNQINSDRD